MSRRPGNLDLSGTTRSATSNSNSPRSRFQFDLPSPRVGEVPPALSPLDAFAQHSRLLAKRFEESQQKGKRLSRLDALEVATEFGKRPNYFRSVSGNSDNAQLADGEDEVAPLPEVPVKHHIAPSDRPVSQYPLMSAVGAESRSNVTSPSQMFDESVSTPKEPDSYFGIAVPRADSPEPYEYKLPLRQGDASPAVPSLTGSIDSLQSSQPRTNTDDSASTPKHGLAPPRSPPHPRSKKSLVSIRSVMNNNEDELAPPSKFSESSHAPRARSPFTPDPHMASRSPSIMSDHSAFQDDYSRPSFNFSRPLSGVSNKDFHAYKPGLSHQPSFDSRMSMDINRGRSPLRQASGSTTDSKVDGSPKHRPGTYDTGSLSGEDSTAEAGQEGAGAPSYIYAKYSLPRGRTVERTSLGERASWMQHQFKWEDVNNDENRSLGEPSPILPPGAFERPLRQVMQSQQARSHSADGRGPATPRAKMHRSSPSSPSVHSHSTDRTVRGHVKGSPSQDIVSMTPEEHLEKGIECHSDGSLSKSTYHLRHAARAGHPTGMLLYALACRHGWGMRANQAEGVQWLKKAVDSSSLELLEQDTAGAGPQGAGATKSRKAQFALAVYELGMSYMNGWGTPKDRALAVRCFEVAGNWGDLDALAEAGFCYTEGIGVKKDLKKAAGLYRRAADGGMSMAGNSWIYKQKYMNESDTSTQSIKSPNPSNSDRSTKGRTRARSIFGRKKSFIN